MSLQIIYGKSGTGKSEYIFNEIAKKIEEGSSKKIYIITPEQFSFTAEKKMLNSIKDKAIINAEVITFGRMAYRVIQERRRAITNILSSCGKSMLFCNILHEQKNKLHFIGKSIDNIDLIETQITEFKKHGITVPILKQTIEQIEDSYIKAKLEDMFFIYEQYDSEIKNHYIDENDSLSILINELENACDFQNCDIYIDEFVGFTKQEYDIIRLLLKKGNDIYLTVCMDDNVNNGKSFKNNYKSDNLCENLNPDIDIFYSNKKTLNKIIEIAKIEHVDILKPIFMEKNYRFKNKELQHLEENIYAVPYSSYKEKVEHIRLLLANNQYSEIESVAENIIKLVRDNKYRYNDISVITKNLDAYSSLCKAVFRKYNIPVFIDEKQDLSKNILVRYILSVLNIFAKNWSYESVFEYIKTGFLNIDWIDICLLENYCLRWGIKGNKWYQGEWNFIDERDDEKDKLIYLRKMYIVPLLELKNNLTKKKTVKDITENLYNYLLENEANVKLENKISELLKEGELEKEKEYENSWKLILEVFDEIVAILGDKRISLERYIDILKMGLARKQFRKNTSYTRSSNCGKCG